MVTLFKTNGPDINLDLKQLIHFCCNNPEKYRKKGAGGIAINISSSGLYTSYLFA